MNNYHDTHQPTNGTKRTTAATVLARIQSEQLKPTPRYAFIAREGIVWGLWGLSVLAGALALAVTVYDGLSAEYALYEATHDNFWTFLVSVLPYIWVIIFAAMAALAVVGIRHTKYGYRYATGYIIGSSLLCSVLGAILFHFLGFGYALDTVLGHQIDQYMSMEKMELALWQAPDQGRLIGVLVPVLIASTTSNPALQFEDSAGKTWTISQNELNLAEMQLLQTRDRVRLLGTTTDATSFHICGVFPLMYGRAMGWSEMQQQRQLFEQTMSAHQQMSGDDMNMGSDQIPPEQLCAHLRMMTRMH